MQNVYEKTRTKPEPTIDIKRPVMDVHGNIIPSYEIVYTFDQLIDHKDPSRGTFKQRYYHTWEFYKPGGPIVLMTPGEQGIDNTFSLLTNTSINGVIARATDGAVVVLEHRFYGGSNPFPDLSVESLKVHTIEQAMEDLVYFAQHVALQMPGGATDVIRPNNTPWILLGGSYAGALVSWTMNMKPDVFWAGYSSSGVIQPQLDFWQYFSPIQRHMPANCSADVQAAIEFVDGVISSGNATAYQDLQTSFGFTNLAPSDFANALTFPIVEWQALDVDTGRDSSFYNFCDTLEIKAGAIAPATGFGAQSALASWATFYRTGYLDDLCEGYTWDECVRFDGSTSAAVTLGDDRSWMWQVCNEVGWAQVGPPENVQGIMSRHFTVQNFSNYCNDAFQGAFTSSTFETRVRASAEKYLGWGSNADRLFIVNGDRDPWLEVTHSAAEARIASSSRRPIFLTDGFHCSDISISNAISPSIAEVHAAAQTIFPQWLKEFKPVEKPSSVTASEQSTSAGSLGGGADTSVSNSAPRERPSSSAMKTHGVLSRSLPSVGIVLVIVTF